MKKIIILTLALLSIVIILVGCQETQHNLDTPQITSFEECAAAGNPIMESYPRKCSANGETFVEEIANEIINQPITELKTHTCTEEQKQAKMCTMEYRPVCGVVDSRIRCITEPCPSTEVKTFGNKCEACSNQAMTYYEGACEDQTFIMCSSSAKSFDPVKHAADVGAICVDLCPTSYDSYMTQIGIEYCIKHISNEDIKTWETCTKSSESCNCVKAYETTANENIENAEYKCVPEEYANRLLFRGGVDRLDTNGEQSVMIA